MDPLSRNNVRISGPTDGQPMLFAHGFGCDQNMWRFVAPAFEDRLPGRPLRPRRRRRLRPRGVRRRAARRRSTGYADDVLEICRGLDLRDVVFVGHSVSAMIGVLAALARPGAVRRAGHGRPVAALHRRRRTTSAASPRPTSTSCWSRWRATTSAGRRAMAPVIMGNADRPELGQELTESFCRTDPEIARRFAEVTFLSDNRADLARVAHPDAGAAVHATTSSPRTRSAEYVRRRRSPTARWCVLDGDRPLPEPQRARGDRRRDPRRSCEVLTGVTGARPAQEAFHAALLEDDPEQLYERAPCGYLSTTPDGIDRQGQRDLPDAGPGYRREDLVGRRTFAELLTRRAAGSTTRRTTRRCCGCRARSGEVALDIVRADGGRLPVLVNAVLERDAGRRPRLVRIAVFDATERREYERELLRAKRARRGVRGAGPRPGPHPPATLIPPAPPDVPGLDVAAAYRPAGTGEEVGGDFYDVFQIGRGRLGGGPRRRLRQGRRGGGRHRPRPLHAPRAVRADARPARGAARRLNEVLIAHGTDRFCTVVLLRLRRADGEWTATISVGGHPLPLAHEAGVRRPQGRGAGPAGRSVPRGRPHRDRDARCTPGSCWCSTPTGSPRAAADASCTTRTACSGS